MLKLTRIVLAVLVVLLAGYGLITKNVEFQPYLMFFLGLMMLVMGLEEFQKGRKGYGWISIIVFLLLLLVALQGFF